MLNFLPTVVELKKKQTKIYQVNEFIFVLFFSIFFN